MPAQEDKHRFFGREYLIRAGWIVLLGFAGFVGAAAYSKFISPNKIVIDDQRQQPITVIVKDSDRGSKTPSAAEVKALTDELKLLRDAYNRQLKQAGRAPMPDPGQPTTVPALPKPQVEPVLPDVQALAEEVRKLRDALAKPQTPPQTSAPKDTTIAAPTFRLPTTVKGYLPVSFLGAIGSTCPANSLKRGEQVKVSFTLTDRNLLNSATPLFMRITRKRDHKYVVQVFERLYELRDGQNALSLTVDLQPADYQLEYGFYLRSELNEEFPKYYRRECTFVIS